MDVRTAVIDVKTAVEAGRPGPHALIERASPSDLMELASEDTGAPMEVGVVLLLGSGSAGDLTAVQDALKDRIGAVPRLRQCLVPVPLGFGRPVWIDDPSFDIRDHVRSLPCPAPGDEPALLSVAAEIVTRRLPSTGPLWSATLVTSLANGGAALIVVFHHVLTDGIGGLAVLAQLVDGARGAPVVDFPRQPPGRHALLLDAWRSRLRTVARSPAGIRRLRGAVAELAPGGSVRLPQSSLNRPTGPRRSLAVARADLEPIRRAAHAHGGTINDVILTAVTGALQTVLRLRGETAGRFVVAVPISARTEASVTQLGNQVGVIRVVITATGDPHRRLAAIVRSTRNRRPAAPSSSSALLGPAFRILARLGAFRWYVDRQRLVSTFVTNLRGPETQLSFLAAPITGVIPVSRITGNITVSFAVLSYAGTLVVTVISDPQRCPDLQVLVEQLQRELDALAADSWD